MGATYDTSQNNTISPIKKYDKLIQPIKKTK